MTHDELLAQLDQSMQSALSSQQLDERVAQVLQDREYVSSVRRAFVDAVHKEALIEPAAIAPCTAIPVHEPATDSAQLHPVSRALLHIMSQHLLAAGDKKYAIIRITALAIFYLLYVSQLTALIRYPLALLLLPALYLATAQTAGPMSAPDPLPLVRLCQRAMAVGLLSMFDDSVVRESVEMCCSWLLLASWSAHHSPGYFIFICCAAALPLLVLLIHSRWKVHPLIFWPIRVIAMLGTLYVLYLSWYSYSTFLFTVLFFFPTLATIALSSVVFVIAAAFPILSYAQSFLYTFSAHPVLYSALYILSTLFTLYYYYFSLSYLRFTLALFSCTLFLPPLLGGGLTVALSFAGQLVATHGLRRLIVMCGELVVLLLMAGGVLVLDWSLRYVLVWLDKRGWLGGSDGRLWAVLHRLLESRAVKTFRVWLRQKAEAASTAGDESAREGEG